MFLWGQGRCTISSRELGASTTDRENARDGTHEDLRCERFLDVVVEAAPLSLSLGSVI